MNIVLKHFKVALLVSVAIFIIMTIVSVLLGNQVIFNTGFVIKFLYYMLYGLFFYGANALVMIYFEKKYGKYNYSKKRIILCFFSSVVVSLISIFILRIIEDVIIEGESFKSFIANETFKNYLIPFIIVVLVLLIFNIFYIYRAFQQNKIKEQKIIAGTASAKFESLKSQLDPHFLFNSLNVLTSLIEEDKDKAQKFTTSLSKIYRYVLEQKDKELVSLEEELQFAKTYMSLLKMRFENAIVFKMSKQVKSPASKVVPLSLQILLENCIKHNIVSEQQPLTVEIKEDDNKLIVINNLQPKKLLKPSSGLGLLNIKERYKILSTRALTINQSKNEFIVQLPLLTKKSSVMQTATSQIKRDNYLNARKRLDKLKEFYGSLVSYVIVIPFLIFINFKTYSGVHWFWFPMLGWGISLVFQAYEVWGKSKYFGKTWEERKIKEFMDEESKTQTWE